MSVETQIYPTKGRTNFASPVQILAKEQYIISVADTARHGTIPSGQDAGLSDSNMVA
jgi:hypothetical protein